MASESSLLCAAVVVGNTILMAYPLWRYQFSIFIAPLRKNSWSACVILKVSVRTRTSYRPEAFRKQEIPFPFFAVKK